MSLFESELVLGGATTHRSPTNPYQKQSMKMITLKIPRFLCWGIALIGALLGLAFLAIVQPGGDGVLGRVQTPDGSEYAVEQTCNWSIEPYTVSFNMRSPDGQWGWCYVDHEASRWKDVQVTYDVASDHIVISERGIQRATLDRRTKVFRIGNGYNRSDISAPQEEGRVPAFASR